MYMGESGCNYFSAINVVPFYLACDLSELIEDELAESGLFSIVQVAYKLHVSSLLNGLERYQNNSYNITSNHKTHQFNEFVFKLIYNKRITPKMLMGFLRYFHSLCSLSISTISSRIIK